MGIEPCPMVKNSSLSTIGSNHFGHLHPYILLLPYDGLFFKSFIILQCCLGHIKCQRNRVFIPFHFLKQWYPPVLFLVNRLQSYVKLHYQYPSSQEKLQNFIEKLLTNYCNCSLVIYINICTNSRYSLLSFKRESFLNVSIKKKNENQPDMVY